MTIPLEYAQAGPQFDRLMEELRLELNHDTRHQAYQTLESVLRIFRRRLTLAQAIGFASALPAVLRAIFVMDWDTGEAPVAFADRESLTREVKAFRKNHDFSPDDAIAVTASVIQRHVDTVAFRLALSRLPWEAQDFWHPS